MALSAANATARHFAPFKGLILNRGGGHPFAVNCCRANKIRASVSHFGSWRETAKKYSKDQGVFRPHGSSTLTPS